jgi:hypothetical protein
MTDGGVYSRVGVVFFNGKWVRRSRIDPGLLSLIFSVIRTVFAGITRLPRYNDKIETFSMLTLIRMDLRS